jgi:hypothetical protein
VEDNGSTGEKILSTLPVHSVGQQLALGNIKPSHCRQRRFVRGPILPAITTRIDVRRTSILDMASDPFVTNKDCASSNPRKKAHRIYDKMLVVIDESLVKRFSIDDCNTWFIQEPTEAGILLRIYKQN